jgi:hypothetical protein
MHTVAQLPQCAVLVSKSMQEPPQFSAPTAQPLPHFPPAQACPAPQAVVQSPQWSPSEARSTHSPPQFS